MINNSVAAATVESPLLRQRAANELHEIDAVARHYARLYAVVPLLQQEPVGVSRLLNLVGHSPKDSPPVDKTGTRSSQTQQRDV